jgi:copper chaperone
MATITLKVNGMSCNHCVMSVEKALKEIGANGSVDLASKQVTVEYDDAAISLETIKEAIEEQGYDVES